VLIAVQDIGQKMSSLVPRTILLIGTAQFQEDFLDREHVCTTPCCEQLPHSICPFFTCAHPGAKGTRLSGVYLSVGVCA
jgi:hypothetical protein